jgi:tetratricopeptide (TPR) repeat protein
MDPIKHLHFATVIASIAFYSGAVLGDPSNRAELPSAPDSTPPRPTVEQLYATAQSQYAAGDLAGALVTMQRCYAVKPSANLLYNLAQLHRELSHCVEALDHYERYLNAAPNGARAADAMRYADSLRRECPPPAPLTPTAVVPVPSAAVQPAQPQAPKVQLEELQLTSTTAQRRWNTVGWVAMGAGAVAAGTAIYFSAKNYQDRKDIENWNTRMKAKPPQSDVDLVEYHRLDSNFKRDRALGFTLGGVAVVAVGIGAYAWLFAAPRERAATTAWSLTVSPSTLGASYRIQF